MFSFIYFFCLNQYIFQTLVPNTVIDEIKFQLKVLYYENLSLIYSIYMLIIIQIQCM